MPEKRASESEALAAHMAATTAAFQVLAQCLQETGALQHGQFQERLRLYMQLTKNRDGDQNNIVLALMDDLRRAL